MGRLAGLGVLLLLAVPLAAGPAPSRVVSAGVTLVKKAGRDWTVLDCLVTAEAAASVSAVLRVLEDYPSYPRLFPKIRQMKTESVPGAVLLSETVVVSALGIENVNRFTLRMVRTETPDGVRLHWTAAWTDGTIDDMEGFWHLENRGTASAPLTRITYHNKSAVPVVVFGQDAFLRLFLGSETKAIVDTVVKTAQSQ